MSGDVDDKKRPGALPDKCELNLPCKDLLLRLLEPDPTKRLRSLRVLQTLAFFMKFDFEDVKKKKVSLFLHNYIQSIYCILY